MQFDDILVHLGAFGPYQRRVYFLLFLISIPGAWHTLAQIFLAGQVDHWCVNPELNDFNCTRHHLDTKQCIEFKRKMSTPRQYMGSNSENTLGSCTRYNLTDFFLDNVYHQDNLNSSYNTNATLLSCDAGWVYDDSQYQSTIIEEYNLVCERSGLVHIAQSVYFAGNLAGSVIFGTMADCIGRTRTMLIALIIWFVSALGTVFAPDVYTYMTLRFFLSGASYGTFLPSYILGTEFVGPSKRTIAGIANQYAFGIGLITLAGIAYFIRDWKTLQLAITIPIALFFLYVPFLAESARWLISQGEYEKAEKIIRKVAKTNQKKLPSVLFEEWEINKKRNGRTNAGQSSFLMLFKTPNMACKTLNIMWNWCVNSLVYYGISLNIPNLGTNDYLVFFISGLIEIPAYTYAFWACQHFGGRKLNLAGALILAGTSCLITSFLSPGLALTCVAMVGKFSATVSFSIIYIFSAEIYPTPVRTVGTGLSSAASRVGGMVAPLVFLMEKTWAPLPFIIFGSSALSAGVLSLLLPETRGKNLPETIEEGEQFGKPKWMLRTCGQEMHKIPAINDRHTAANDKVDYSAIETEEMVSGC